MMSIRSELAELAAHAPPAAAPLADQTRFEVVARPEQQTEDAAQVFVIFEVTPRDETEHMPAPVAGSGIPNMDPRSLIWPLVIALSIIALLIAFELNWSGAPRVALALWGLLVCPGLALVRLLRLPNRVMEWTLALALSLAIDSAVAASFVYAGGWTTTAALALVAAITLAGVGLELLRTGCDAWRAGHSVRMAVMEGSWPSMV